MIKWHFILLVVFSNTLFAQSKIDSLEALLPNISGIEKVEVLNEIAVSYYKISLNKMIEYSKKGLELSKKLDYNLGEAKSLHIIGKGHSDLGNHDKSLEYYMKSLKILEDIKSTEGIANCLNNIGIVYRKLGNYEKSLGFYLRALKIREQIGNKEYIAGSINNIGVIYWHLKNYDKALEYYLKF